jgi:hypothetical protein
MLVACRPAHQPPAHQPPAHQPTGAPTGCQAATAAQTGPYSEKRSLLGTVEGTVKPLDEAALLSVLSKIPERNP